MKTLLAVMVALLLIGSAMAQPALMMDTTGLSFQPTPVGVGEVLWIYMVNTGDQDLTVTASVTNDVFRVVHPGLEFVISPRDSIAGIVIGFTPADSIRYTGELHLLTNDPLRPELTIPLAGSGIPAPPPPPPTVILMAPEFGAVVVPPVTFVWHALPIEQPVTYSIWIDGLPVGGVPICFEAGADTQLTVNDLRIAWDGVYAWYVLARWNGDSIISDRSLYSIGEPNPPHFDLLAPQDNSVHAQLPIEMSWESAGFPWPVTYRVWITTIDSFELGEFAYDVGSATQFTLNDPRIVTGHQYGWWVTAYWGNDSLRSIHGFWFRLGTEPPPPPSREFELTSPESQATVTANHQEFVWSNMASISAPVTYTLWIQAMDSMSVDTHFVYEVGSDTSFTVDMTGLVNHVYYYWFVVGHEDRLPDVRSHLVRGFTLELNGGFPEGADDSRSDALPKRFGIAEVYPNPFNPQTSIRIAVPQAGLVRAEIFDVLGRKAVTLVNGQLAAGNHDFTWRADGPAGMYMLRVTGPNGAHDVQRLMFIK
jgi:hypothetical protein